jgi:transcriptional regulator with XRE-family HTH domain
MDALKLFGRRLRVARRAAKITQEQAAEVARLNPKYLGELERGEKRPSFEAILALARALHASPAVFFQFDRAESDEKALRRKMDALLQKSNPQQLQQAYRLPRALLEP